MSRSKSITVCILFVLLVTGLHGCANKTVRKMEVTAYCGCGECCNWERGSWLYLKLDFWNKYISKGKYAGRPYSGLTASGTKPHEPQPGLFSINSITHFWMIPFRIIFPWLWFSHDGTIAADTRYHKFGTRMYVPGYGYGVIEDRGGAIKGPNRLDLFYSSHSDALKWGRKHINVTIYK